LAIRPVQLPETGWQLSVSNSGIRRRSQIATTSGHIEWHRRPLSKENSFWPSALWLLNIRLLRLADHGAR
jgi:hypothetical protein